MHTADYVRIFRNITTIRIRQELKERERTIMRKEREEKK
jgi:hypothetical protein